LLVFENINQGNIPTALPNKSPETMETMHSKE